MAMSNRERQAKWRARLKEAAAKKSRVQDAFREHMRSVLYDEARYAHCESEEELEIRLQAADAMIAESDDKITEVLNALILAWHEDECLTRSTRPTPGARARPSRGG